jgi:hypothetical protein
MLVVAFPRWRIRENGGQPPISLKVMLAWLVKVSFEVSAL